MLSYFQFEIVRTFSLLWLLRSQQCRQGFKAAPLPMLPTHGGNWTFCYVRAVQVPLLGYPKVTLRPHHSKMEHLPLLAYLSCLQIPPCWVHHPSVVFISIQHSVWRSYPYTDFGINRKATLTSCHWCWEKTLIYLNFLQDRYFQSSIVKGKLQLYTEPKITR